jgi:hypothetical protein
MRALKIGILLALAVAAFMPAFSQQKDEKKADPSVILAINPLYTLQNAMRIDVDFRLSRNNWITIGPQYYVAKDKYMDLFLGNDEATDMNGYGIDFLHKIILSQKNNSTGPYLAYGVRYVNFSYTYNGFSWVQKLDEWGTHYYELEKGDVTEKNNRYGFNIIFGMQNIIEDRFFIDVYTGVGIQVSNMSPETANISNNSDFFLRYNYSGPRFLLGIRMGVALF